MEQVSMLSAYMWSCVVMIVFFLFAVLAANMIIFKPGDTGVIRRKVWFWILAAATLVVGFLINYFIASDINIPNIKSDYIMHSVIAAIVAFIIYILIGFVLSKIFSKSKIGTWF